MDTLKDHINSYIHLNEREWALIKSKIELKKIRKKDFFVREGEIFKYEAFVLKGCFQIYHINEKDNKHVIYFAPESFWLIDPNSFNNRKPSPLYIQALEEAEVALLSLKNKQALLKEIPSLEKFFRLFLEHVYQHSHAKMIRHSGKTAKDKYIDFITENPSLKNRLSNLNIANYLEVTPEVISKIRTELYSKKQ